MNNKEISLCKKYSDYFPIGVAASERDLNQYKDFYPKHFNSITAENEMKLRCIQQEENKFDFNVADKFVKYAVDNNMKVRGHALIWHHPFFTPRWLFEDHNGNQASKEQVLERMENHIKTVVGRYKGKIYAWDVVNEAIADVGSKEIIWKKRNSKKDQFEKEENKAGIYRNTKWLEIIGEDYMEKAFQFAHEADPDAVLFYNDYNAEIPEKRDNIYSAVKKMLDNGAPVHGIGLQGHFNIYDFDPDQVKMAIEKYASLGVKIQFTEVDMSVYDWLDYIEPLGTFNEKAREMQDKAYESLFKVLREYKDVVTGLTFWGTSDRNTWLDNFPMPNRKNWPMLFDEKENPKSAFYKITDF